MTQAVYEFPLNEKVRTYLRLEQIFKQLEHVEEAKIDWQYTNFLNSLFTLLDLLERIDIRTDILKDIDIHEKNLNAWSQHPKIDSSALQAALQKIIRIRDDLKRSKKLGVALKEDKFLSSIRQRFAVPGGTSSFDLPNLYYWLHQPKSVIETDIKKWMQSLSVLHEAINITLSFLRERGKFNDINTPNAVHQGGTDEKHELIRVYCHTDQGYYPLLSGNKYRYVIRFMWYDPTPEQAPAVEQAVSFQLARC